MLSGQFYAIRCSYLYSVLHLYSLGNQSVGRIETNFNYDAFIV